MNRGSVGGLLPGLALGGLGDGGSKRFTCWMHEPLDRLISYAGHIIYSVNDPSGVVKWHSNGQEELLGQPLQGCTFEDLQSAIVEHVLIGALEGRDLYEAKDDFWQGRLPAWEAEFVCRLPDGSLRRICNYMVPILDGDGAVTGGLGFLTNIQPEVDRLTALASAEERSRSIFSQAPIGIHIFEVDERGEVRFTSWNPAASAITGIDYESIAGMTIQDAFGAAVAGNVLDKIIEVANKGGAWQGPFASQRTGLQGRHYNLHAFASEPGRVVCFFDDTTEKDAAQLKVIESEGKFRGLVENMSEGLISICNGKIVTYASPGMGRLMEEPPEALVGLAFSELVAPEHTPLMDRVMSLIDMGICEPVEFKILRASGERRWVRAMFQPKADKGSEISAVILDINDRKRNEAAILAAEERMRLMLDAVAGQVAIVDVEGRFAFASPQWCRALGYAAEGELLGMSSYNFVDSDGEAVVRSLLFEATSAKEKTPITGGLTLYSNDCRLHDVMLTVVPMLDNPVIDGFVCQMEVLRTRSKDEAA